jgi:signal transduction histidine kinase
MPDAPPIYSAPPVARRLGRLALDEAFGGRIIARKQSFWGGWGGVAMTVVMAALVVTLLVGWVLLWVRQEGSPNLTLLVLGCVGFALLLTMLFTVQNRLSAYWRMSQAEAAYLAGVSHNLRTPVSAIRAAAQTLQQTTLDSDQRAQFLEAIVRETRRLALRIDNALETGRLEVERRTFSQAVVPLHGLLDRCVTETALTAEARGGRTRLSIEGELWVRGDERALKLLLDNLLDNALKYTDGPPDIAIQASDNGDFALIQVIDSGSGFDPKETARLFRRFGRGDTTRPGTGLGLSLAQAIARGHGGDLHLHSHGDGTGAVAEVWLLRAEES